MLVLPVWWPGVVSLGRPRCSMVISVSPAPAGSSRTSTVLSASPVLTDRQVNAMWCGGSTTRYSPVCRIAP